MFSISALVFFFIVIFSYLSIWFCLMFLGFTVSFIQLISYWFLKFFTFFFLSHYSQSIFLFINLLVFSLSVWFYFLSFYLITFLIDFPIACCCCFLFSVLFISLWWFSVIYGFLFVQCSLLSLSHLFNCFLIDFLNPLLSFFLITFLMNFPFH